MTKRCRILFYYNIVSIALLVICIGIWPNYERVAKLHGLYQPYQQQSVIKRLLLGPLTCYPHHIDGWQDFAINNEEDYRKCADTAKRAHQCRFYKEFGIDRAKSCTDLTEESYIMSHYPGGLGAAVSRVHFFLLIFVFIPVSGLQAIGLAALYFRLRSRGRAGEFVAHGYRRNLILSALYFLVATATVLVIAMAMASAG